MKYFIVLVALVLVGAGCIALKANAARPVTKVPDPLAWSCTVEKQWYMSIMHCIHQETGMECAIVSENGVSCK